MTLKASTLRTLMLAALIPALAAFVLVAGAGPGYKYGLWHFRVSFDLMRWGVYLGLAGVALSLVAGGLRLRQRRPIFWCLTALVLGGVAAGFPISMMRTAKSVPPIHDISTDTEKPPEFVDVLKLRGEGTNPVAYDPAVAELQRAAYPDITPLVVEQPLPAAFERARDAAKQMKWEVVGEDAAAGRLEATATTAWFGFKDDVVVRISETGSGHSRIDVRSVSRVGKSDLGANAARIRQYLALLK